MHSRVILSIAVLNLFFSPAYALEQTESTTQKSSQQETRAATNKSDPEVIAWLIEVNEGEINAAKLAKTKNVSSAIKDYADMMITEHSKNLTDTLNLKEKLNLNPIKTSSVRSFKAKGEKELSKLKGLNNKQFEVEYTKAMVDGHDDALKSADKYLTEVNNPDLKNHLTNTKDTISKHLDMAKTLKEQLN